MGIDDRLRDAVRDVQADPAAWAGIEQGVIRHRRRVVVARAATALTVLALAGGALALAVAAFRGPELPIGPPPGAIAVTDVRWAGGSNGVWTITGRVSNRSARSLMVVVSCTLRDEAGDTSAVSRVQAGLVAGHRHIPFAGTAKGLRAEPVGADCSAQGSTVVAPPVTPAAVANFQPQAVVFFDSQHGLSGGSDGACDTSCTGVMERSTDGGSTWQPVWTGDGIVDDLTALGPNEAWATIDKCRSTGIQGCSNLILHSGDGGATWTELVMAPVYRLSFATPDVGWAISTESQGSPAAPLANTVDGGRTWTTVADPCPAGAPFPTSIRFASVDQGWLACEGEGATIMSAKAILKSAEGGTSWVPQSEVFAPGSGATVPVGGLSIDGHQPGLAFRPDGHGWMWLDRDCLYGTADSGANWTRLGICQPDLQFVSSACLVDDLHGFALVSSADKRTLELRATDDGGATFHVVASWPLA
jgi:photosystem II stability/assembly factor-like uncharacterized protein